MAVVVQQQMLMWSEESSPRPSWCTPSPSEHLFFIGLLEGLPKAKLLKQTELTVFQRTLCFLSRGLSHPPCQVFLTLKVGGPTEG